VFVEILKEKPIQGKEVTTVVEENRLMWMTLIMEEGTIPNDRKEARKLRIKARQYELLEGVVYKRSFLTSWLRCVRPLQANQVKKLVWDNIMCRFGLSEEIVSDNGKQFSANPFKDWCDKLNITQRFASVKHSQSNGLIERANWSLREGIKARLAVIPVEIRMPTYRIAVVDVVCNDEELRLNLDLLKGLRECATIREAKAKFKMTKYNNARVRGVTFRPGDFVYHSNDASHVVEGRKL
nr:hypothetical protein [Tanacetum cinerariifolium]